MQQQIPVQLDNVPVGYVQTDDALTNMGFHPNESIDNDTANKLEQFLMLTYQKITVTDLSVSLSDLG